MRLITARVERRPPKPNLCYNPAIMPRKRNTAKHSKMRTKLLQNLAKGMNKSEAARAAGYAHPVSGLRALARMDLDVGHLLDLINLPVIKVLQKLKQKLEAEETKFFQKDGIVMETRNVIAHDIQLRAATELAHIIGLYPRNGHSGPDSGGGEGDQAAAG